MTAHQPFRAGALGIYGDFLFSEATQGHRGPLAAALGPVAGIAEEAMNLTHGNLIQLAQGKEAHFWGEAVRFGRGITPFANLWYAKAGLDRLVFHQLQEYFSPGYLSTMQSRARREFGQEWWWKPRELTPSRPPDLSNLTE